MASLVQNHRTDGLTASRGHVRICKGQRVRGCCLARYSTIKEMGPDHRLAMSHGQRAESSVQCAVVASSLRRGGVGQLGMAHRSDGPASSLRMFGHVHRAMCGGGCQFEVLEEHVCA